MFKTTSLFMFFSSLLLGMIVAISSSSWFGIWIGLELNLLSFIPILMLNSESASVEAGLKYFLVQACSSLILLQSSVFMSKVSSLFLSLTMAALVMKVGGAPFHFWFPMVSEGLSWNKVMVLFTIQKIAPLTLISYLYNSELVWMYIGVILLSGSVGAVGGLNEMYLRKLLSFSSISHLSWMLLGMMAEGSVWLLYFIFYVIISLSLMFILQSYQVFHFSQIFSKGGMFVGLNLGFSFMSLGGLPPFTGFMPKWLVIQASMTFIQGSLVIFLICTSLITLFYYLRVSLKVFSFTKVNWEISINSKNGGGLENIILLFNLTGLLVISGVWSSSLLH